MCISSIPRLIPAHAGKTDRSRQSMFVRAAHPRSRGENTSTADGARRMSGSSPLTRGKRGAWHVTRDGTGLIPAHAGKTGPARQAHRREGAHPRSRGENDLRGGRDVPARGSSPLTRGKLSRASRARCQARLIPAHAGKTSTPKSRPRLARAHPRSRGENLMNYEGDIEPGWLIPAHAGKTHSRIA